MFYQRAIGSAFFAIFIFATSLSAAEPTPKIAWIGTRKDGLAEAKRTNRPILLVSGAPHCHGVPGVW